jgi:flagellar motor protein MotB
MNVPHFRTAWILLLLPLAVGAQDVDETPLGEAVERHLSLDEPIMQWVQDPERVDHEVSDTIELREGLTNGLETIKLTGLVPPIYFETGVAQIPTTTVASLGEILGSMRDRMNVRLHLVGHADNQPLSARLVAIYGDNLGLSRERAGEVAEYMQTALALPPEGVSYAWEGDLNPAASNDTAAGRAQNRRVEVEVWYDEVRQKATLEEVLVKQEAKTLKVCRMQTVCKLRYVDGHARRARVQNLIAPLYFDAESIDVSDDFIASVQEAFTNLSGKQNVVVKFVGHTDGLPLTGRVERIYGDQAGLSKARARRVALAVQDGLDLPTDIVMSDGRGAGKPIASNDTARGRALNRRVEVEFWYDDPLQELPDEPQLCPGDRYWQMGLRACSRARLKMLVTRQTHACDLSATHATNDWHDAQRVFTGTTSACPRRVRAVQWTSSLSKCSSIRHNGNLKAVASSTPTMLSMRASCRARLRMWPCRSSTMNSLSSTITRVSISHA